MDKAIKTRIEEINSGKVPSGYKKTKIGIFPVDWKISRLKEYLTESRIDGSNGAYARKITVKLWNKGVFEKREIHQGSENTLYYKRKSGQLVYSKLDFLNCAFGIIPKDLDGFESTLDLPAFDIKNIDSYYLLAYVTRPEFYFHYGTMVADGGRKARRVNPNEMLSFLIALPPIEEQEKIAEILKTQDRVIELKERLLKEKQREKKFLMQQLLTGKIRLKGFTDEWRKNELGSLLDYIQPAKYIIKNDLYQNNGIPVITAGKSFILGFTNEKEDVFSAVPVIVFDDFTTGCQFVDFPFKCKSSAIKILTNHKNVNLLFIYEKMKKINYKVAGHERHWISKYSLLPIYIPSYEEQNAIAEIITTKDMEIALIKQQIESEKQKKKALMQLLLSGIVRVQ